MYINAGAGAAFQSSDMTAFQSSDIFCLCLMQSEYLYFKHLQPS